MTSSTSEKTIATARDRAARERQSDIAFLRLTMSTPQGRGWAWRQLEFAGVFRPTDISDHATMSWREGQRNVGLKLLHELLTFCPTQFITMMAENSSTPATEPQKEESDDD